MFSSDFVHLSGRCGRVAELDSPTLILRGSSPPTCGSLSALEPDMETEVIRRPSADFTVLLGDRIVAGRSDTLSALRILHFRS